MLTLITLQSSSAWLSSFTTDEKRSTFSEGSIRRVPFHAEGTGKSARTWHTGVTYKPTRTDECIILSSRSRTFHAWQARFTRWAWETYAKEKHVSCRLKVVDRESYLGSHVHQLDRWVRGFLKQCTVISLLSQRDE